MTKNHTYEYPLQSMAGGADGINKYAKVGIYLRHLIEICILTYIVVIPFNNRASLSDSALVMIAIVWTALMFFEKKIIFKKTSLNIPAGILILVSILSAFFSIDPAYSFDYIRSEILKSFLILFAIINFMDEERQIKRLIWFIIASFTVMNIYGIVEYYITLAHEGKKLDATLGHHNKVGMFADLVFPVILIMFLKIKGWKTRLPLSISIIVGMIVIIFAQSRGSWVSIILSLLIIGVFYERKVLGAVAITFAILPLLLPGTIIKRFITIFDFGNYLKPKKVLIERPFVWQASFKIIKKYPFLGAGTGTDIFYKLYVEKGLKPKKAKQKLGHAHNQMLQTLVENGIAGFLAQTALFVSFFCTVFAGRKKYRNTFREVIIIGCAAGIIAIFFHGFVGTFLRSRMVIMVMIIMGTAVACCQTPSEEDNLIDRSKTIS
ncbi:MAG: O-antigen ligase family protein [Candidatus Schekmanbacteria bacterium]|nr:O-antigen ligase family protein [Candidatus Schekmanbacteria bacterium]